MGRKSRNYLKQREELAELIHARNSERNLSEDVLIRGIGVRRLQVVRLPSFTTGDFWDVGQREEKWRLFRGEIPRSVHRVRGYSELNADARMLGAFFKEVCALTLPLNPILNSMIGWDGTSFRLAVFGDTFSALRIEWWTEYPKGWEPVVAVARRMMKYFDTLSLMEN